MDIYDFFDKVTEETGKIIFGKAEQTRLILAALLADGHILLDDLPGVGKTSLVKALSIVLGLDSSRIQFVPDLLPGDIIGMNIYDRASGAFKLMKGPVFTNFLLADEINRAVPRTQAALLEAMEERTVTIDGRTLPLSEPFTVMATQNPVESESTFRLPAAQMDRFMIKLSIGYPSASEEKDILKKLGDDMPFASLNVLSSPGEIMKFRRDVGAVTVQDSVAEYMVSITAATRSFQGVVMGASPRATKALYRISKAWAVSNGRSFVTPDDVKYLAPYVLTHRIILSSSASLGGSTPEKVISGILASVPVPPKQQELFN